MATMKINNRGKSYLIGLIAPNNTKLLIGSYQPSRGFYTTTQDIKLAKSFALKTEADAAAKNIKKLTLKKGQIYDVVVIPYEAK